MIQKSEQQDIDREGRRLLREALEPLGWVLTGFEEDYGIDYDVQIFVKGSPDGLWFKIQLKSSISSDYSADGTFVSVQLNIDHAKHYALEMRDPVFLIHADIQSRKIFWTAPQLDNELVRKLTAGENSSTVSLRVPTSNLLPGSAEQLLQTVERTYVVLGHRTLANSSISSFADALKHQPGEEKLREEFQQKGDFLRFRKIQELFAKRQYEEARSRAQHIVSDPDSSLENRFWAQDNLGAIGWAAAVTKGKSQPELPLIYLGNAEKLQEMSRKGPPHLKLYALIARKTAELDMLAVHNWGLTILLHQHRTAAGNLLMELSANAAHALSTRQVIAKYNQCLRLARYASNFKGRWILPPALARIPQATASFIGRIV